MNRKIFIVISLLLSTLAAACTSSPRLGGGTVAVENRDMKAVLVFSDRDRERIKHYYARTGKRKSLPPGLAKKEELPPGLQKHIQKYGELPPGLQGKRLPSELNRTLSRLPEGYVRLKVGTEVVLMNEKTRVIFDVIWNVD